MTPDPLDLDAVEATIKDSLGHQDSCWNPREGGGTPLDGGGKCTCGAKRGLEAVDAPVTRLRAAEAECARLRGDRRKTFDELLGADTARTAGA